ncbi:sensor histidine kinase [Marinifilum caeruleilacunae]|uniref:histidine kinase n=1 Tax=Marinifilum caeruleilacunae TaxID=2499076 RepID=A0ABX1X163_9BACT|nr:HAMP domain-containing sensor histidine kinase [Marinifilum caeruleilacunae]NOU62027.1 HAMP domain-containing histidine kinase [Marinifilum caeruleilacunae]
MKNVFLKRIGVLILLILSILIFSQVLWLQEQIKKEKDAFVSRLEERLSSVIHFHALKGYSPKNQDKTDTTTINIDESQRKSDHDNSREIARYDINTSKYSKDFSLFKAIEATFTNKSLEQGKIKLEVIDSLFQNNFSEIDIICCYKMELLKNEHTIDSLFKSENDFRELKNDLNQIHFSLGTTNTYAFRFSFKLHSFPFLQQMVYTISVSGIAVILVAIFMIWLLWALQERIDRLQWREQAVRGIVHDLKSPLSFVYTFLDYMASKEQQATVKKQVENASTNISKLSGKMDLILSLFGNQNQKMLISPSDINFMHVCNEILSELRVVYQNKQIDCKLDFDQDLVLAVDPFYFEAVVRNLMDNAFKYSDSTPKLVIEARKEKSKLHLYFTDCGYGISPIDQKKVFREYYRASSTIKGHGIGLSFSMKIVKSHRGHITLSSDTGKGSTFCIILPSETIVT